MFDIIRDRFTRFINIKSRIFGPECASPSPVNESGMTKDLSKETEAEIRDLVKRLDSIWFSFMKFDIHFVIRYNQLWDLIHNDPRSKLSFLFYLLTISGWGTHMNGKLFPS
jgi:hypothetical protein